MTASPYHQGTNDKGADKKLHQMKGELTVKKLLLLLSLIPIFRLLQAPSSNLPISPAQESFSYIDSYPSMITF